MKFKLQGVGLDTTTLDYSPKKLKINKDSFNYILTNPAANNDFLIKDYIGYLNTNTALVTVINYVDGVDEVLQSHLRCLGRTKYDLLFLNSDLNFEVFDKSVETIRDLKIVENFGLSYPKDLYNFKKSREYLTALGYTVDSVLLNISPLYFQKDIINYCEMNGITIYSSNSFGGWINSRSAIKSYSVPYLLNFAACYSNVVLLSSRDMYLATENCNYLGTIMDEMIEADKNYMMKGNVDKLIKEPKKEFSTALVIEGMVLPYDSPDYTFKQDEVKLSKFPILPEIKKNRDDTELEMKIDELIDVVYKTPELGDDDYFVALRYKIEEFLDISHPGWEKTVVKVTDKIMYLNYKLFVDKKKWYGKLIRTLDSEKTYLLFYSDGIIKFRELDKKKEIEKP